VSKRKRGGGRASGGGRGNGGSGAGLAVVGATALAPRPPVIEEFLDRQFFGDRVPANENYRTHYGKLLDLTLIDVALREAERGGMQMLTDVCRETVQLDGHLSAILQKRINRLAALDHQVTPASGSRVNPKKADAYASFVRDQLDGVERFRDAITDLAWGVFDGRAASELDWRYMDGDQALLGLHWIHPRRLSFGCNRDVQVIDSSRGSGGGFRDTGFPLERIPYKFAVYRPRLFNDYPEREGLAPRCLYWSRFVRFGVHERNLLLELFGRPWRIIKPMLNAQGTPLANNVESGKAAYKAVQALGYNTVARLPAGFDLDIHQPFTGAGQVSAEVIDFSTKVLSKLVLGNTGTTDAVSTGLGSSIGNAHLSEEDLIIWSDARRLAETIEDQITDAMIAVNFGPEEVVHAPRFSFRTEAPTTREEEAARFQKALDLGLPVSLEEMREKLGIQEIKQGEPYIIKVQRPAEFGQLAPPAAPEIVYPIGLAPQPGELAPEPLGADGLNNPPGGVRPGQPTPDPSALPGGALPPATPPALPASRSQPPDVDEPDAVAALCDKMNEYQIAACEHGRKNLCEWCGIERERDVEMVNGEAQWIIKWKPLRKPIAPQPAV
jgi:phage gp29-like protein